MPLLILQLERFTDLTNPNLIRSTFSKVLFFDLVNLGRAFEVGLASRVSFKEKTIKKPIDSINWLFISHCSNVK